MSIGKQIETTLSNPNGIKSDINTSHKLQSSLNKEIQFEAKLTNENNVGIKLTSSREISSSLGGVYVTGGVSYNGDYEVTSKAYEEQILSTKNKVMQRDFVVLKIPYAEVSNNSGGMTASIGNEV